MSRLTIDHFLILWSLRGSFRCCERDCTPLQTTPETLAFFNRAYPFTSSHLKYFCLRRTKSTQIDLINAITETSIPSGKDPDSFR